MYRENICIGKETFKKMVKQILGWVLFFCEFLFCLCLFDVISIQKKNLSIQEKQIEKLKDQNRKLIEKQNNLDWWYSRLDRVDEYIRAIDVLKINAPKNYPELERARDEMDQERFEIYKQAIYFTEKFGSLPEKE